MDRLPQNCLTTAALLDDDEYAKLVAEAEERDDMRGGGPSLATWTPELNALASLNDKMAVFIEMQKKKPGKPDLYDRPRTKAQRLKAQRANAERWAAHERLAARVIAKPAP